MVDTLILLGPPGSGKGTQAALLRDELGFELLSTGALLRAAREAGTETGRRAAAFMDRGDLVPDDVVATVVEHAIAELAGRRVILDGFPRTVAQSEALDRMLEEIDRELLAVLYFQVPDELAVERLHVRSLQEGRTDDTPEIIRHRLEVFHKRTEPVVEYYRSKGILVGIHAERPIDAVFAEVQEVLETASTRQ